VGGEDVSKGGKVVVGEGTNVLDTNNIIPIQKRLEVRDDFEVTGDQTSRETEATGVDIGGDNGDADKLILEVKLTLISTLTEFGLGKLSEFKYKL
jgi:hypothetical protein